MKNVVLVTANEQTTEFDTIIEAQQYAATLSDGEFFVYTLFATGKKTLTWDTNVAPVANAIENKKAKKESIRKGQWSKRELEVLKQAVLDGKTVKDIAAGLKREINAIQYKIRHLKLVVSNAKTSA